MRVGGAARHGGTAGGSALALPVLPLVILPAVLLAVVVGLVSPGVFR